MSRGIFITYSSCSEQTQWFFRLQLMNMSGVRCIDNIISFETLDERPLDQKRPITQEAQYELTEQFLFALYGELESNFTKTRYSRTIEGIQWNIDADEGITLVKKHGDSGRYYATGVFRLNDTSYKVSAEFVISRNNKPRLLLRLDGIPKEVYCSQKYVSVLPTGKNKERRPIVGESFDKVIRDEDLSGLIFEECTFKNMSFIDVNLSGATFRRCTFTDVNFTYYFEGNNARFTTVEECIFDRVSLRGSVWTGTVWHNCQFVTPLSMRPYDFKEPDFDYETYEKCRKSGDIFFPTGTPGLYERHLPGMIKPNRFIRPAKDGDYLIPLHDKFTYVPIDGAYMLIGDKGLADGSVSPTNEMLWDAFRISRPNVDNPLGLMLATVW